jgi:hypothetical protein
MESNKPSIAHLTFKRELLTEVKKGKPLTSFNLQQEKVI